MNRFFFSCLCLVLIGAASSQACAYSVIPQNMAPPRTIRSSENRRVFSQNVQRTYQRQSTLAEENRARHAQMQALRASLAAQQRQEENVRRQEELRRQREQIRQQAERDRMAKLRAEQQAARQAQTRYRVENRAAQIGLRQEYRRHLLQHGQITTPSERSVMN